MPNDEAQLSDRVLNWMQTEGYPLEFRTAIEFEKVGFAVRQGDFVRSIPGDVVREIDVQAFLSGDTPAELIRIYNVVECKWSQDKPWVVLTRSRGGMAPSACITQAVASDLGESLMWLLAADKQMQRISSFASVRRPGFSGRRAFAKGEDVFYNALQGVIANSVSLVKGYDDPRRRRLGQLPTLGAIALPVIVLDGRLFEAFFDSKDGEMKLQETKQTRIHWRGADSRNRLTTVDIVTLDGLPEFVAERRADCELLLSRAMEEYAKLHKCESEGSMDHLDVRPASRGVLGAPRIIVELQAAVALRRKALADGQSKATDTNA